MRRATRLHDDVRPSRQRLEELFTPSTRQSLTVHDVAVALRRGDLKHILRKIDGDGHYSHDVLLLVADPTGRVNSNDHFKDREESMPSRPLSCRREGPRPRGSRLCSQSVFHDNRTIVEPSSIRDSTCELQSRERKPRRASRRCASLWYEEPRHDDGVDVRSRALPVTSLVCYIILREKVLSYRLICRLRRVVSLSRARGRTGTTHRSSWST